MALPQILFQDDTMLAFDKPHGVPVSPERGNASRAAALMPRVQAELGDAIANVHRLDTDASGVLLCAKTKPALDYLSGQFQGKTAVCVYHALVALLPPGKTLTAKATVRADDGLLPDTFIVDHPLAEDADRPGCMRVCSKRDRAAKACATEFRTLERFRGFAWVECRPLTARPHQIRLHLAAAGAPVLHDPLYGDPRIELRLSQLKRGYKGQGDEKPLIARLALHASAFTLKHPATREPFTIESPLPHELEIALKYLRKFAAIKNRPADPAPTADTEDMI